MGWEISAACRKGWNALVVKPRRRGNPSKSFPPEGSFFRALGHLAPAWKISGALDWWKQFERLCFRESPFWESVLAFSSSLPRARNLVRRKGWISFLAKVWAFTRRMASECLTWGGIA